MKSTPVFASAIIAVSYFAAVPHALAQLLTPQERQEIAERGEESLFSHFFLQLLDSTAAEERAKSDKEWLTKSKREYPERWASPPAAASPPSPSTGANLDAPQESIFDVMTEPRGIAIDGLQPTTPQTAPGSSSAGKPVPVTADGTTIPPNSQFKLTGPGGSMFFETGSDTRVTVWQSTAGPKIEVAGGNVLIVPGTSAVPAGASQPSPSAGANIDGSIMDFTQDPGVPILAGSPGWHAPVPTTPQTVQIGGQTVTVNGPLEARGQAGEVIVLTSMDTLRPNSIANGGRNESFGGVMIAPPFKVNESDAPQPVDRVVITGNTAGFFPDITGQALKTASADSLRGSGVEKTLVISPFRAEGPSEEWEVISQSAPTTSQGLNIRSGDAAQRQAVSTAGGATTGSAGTGSSVGSGTGTGTGTGTTTTPTPPATSTPPATTTTPPATTPPVTMTPTPAPATPSGNTVQSASGVQFASSVGAETFAHPLLWDATVSGQRITFVQRDSVNGQETERIEGNFTDSARRNPSILRLPNETNRVLGVPNQPDPQAQGVNSGRHIVFGAPVPPGTFPTVGTFTYNFVATTSPTYSFGTTTPGTLTGSAAVDFATLRVGVGMTATMPDQTYSIQTPGGTANPALSPVTVAKPGSEEPSHFGFGRFTTSPVFCARGCDTRITGHFYGAGAAFTSILFTVNTNNAVLNGAALGQR